MKKIVLTAVMSLISLLGFSQAYMYVNKDTVYMREHPSLKSRVVLLIHAPTKIVAEEISDTTADGRELAKEWVGVKFFINDGTWLGGKTYYGFVKKEYLVPRLSLLTADVDTTIQLSYTEMATDTTPMHQARIDFKETFTGQCYYLNSNAKREYVNSEFCRRDDLEEQVKEKLEE
jgi:hypothetical protein